MNQPADSGISTAELPRTSADSDLVRDAFDAEAWEASWSALLGDDLFDLAASNGSGVCDELDYCARRGAALAACEADSGPWQNEAEHALVVAAARYIVLENPAAREWQAKWESIDEMQSPDSDEQLGALMFGDDKPELDPVAESLVRLMPAEYSEEPGAPPDPEALRDAERNVDDLARRAETPAEREQAARLQEFVAWRGGRPPTFRPAPAVVVPVTAVHARRGFSREARPAGGSARRERTSTRAGPAHSSSRGEPGDDPDPDSDRVTAPASREAA